MILTLTCKNPSCGQSFKYNQLGGPVPDYCPRNECQQIRSDRTRQRAREWKRKLRGSGLTYETPRACEHCGEMFTPDRNVHHGKRTCCYKPECEDKHAAKRQDLQRQAGKRWARNKARGTNPRGLRGANKRRDQVPQKSGRRCVGCGRDPAPNILRCPACFAKICDSGIDYEMGLFL